MPAAKGCRVSRRVAGDKADVMSNRQEKNNLSELQVNWIGKCHLNAGESDLMYKYHVAHLSEVYRSRSKINNETPRSVARPPPWANLDPGVLSPIPNKKKREAKWDKQFFRGNCLQNGVNPSAAADGVSRSGRVNTTRRRPASAGVSRGHGDSLMRRTATVGVGSGGRLGRPSSATVRRLQASSNCDRDDIFTSSRVAHGEPRRPSCGGTPGRRENDEPPRKTYRGGLPSDDVAKNGASSNGDLSVEEREIVNGGYTLDCEQKAAFGTFVDMLVNFDTCTMLNIIDDAFREAQSATSLQDFTGCGHD